MRHTVSTTRFQVSSQCSPDMVFLNVQLVLVLGIGVQINLHLGLRQRQWDQDKMKQDTLEFFLSIIKHWKKKIYVPFGLPWWLRWWSVCLQWGRPGFDPWVGKISWRRKWQPTPVLLPGKFHGRRNLVGYSPWGRSESDTTERLQCWKIGVSGNKILWNSEINFFLLPWWSSG